MKSKAKAQPRKKPVARRKEKAMPAKKDTAKRTEVSPSKRVSEIRVAENQRLDEVCGCTRVPRNGQLCPAFR